ncbi:MAG TPA: SGNH/GDSL hydrolase family protein [Streptosporangiaceae bacterium]|nr:SGNH/GDSL hydrolase family protein [Streptosporangiaceae bacterium]
MTTFTALGDSITLGVGDPVRLPDSRQRAWRGWAGLLAESLHEPALRNLATNGACAADIARDQLPMALAERPDVASVVFGINDTLRPGFDQDKIYAAAARTVGELRSAGAEVLTMRLPDSGWMLGLPDALARPLARRTAAVNAAVDAVAQRFGTLHFDAAGNPATYDKRMWAVDRLHPNERGHRLIARSFHDLLRGAGLPVGPAPDPEPENPPPTKRAQFAWMATKGTGWVLKRSTDLVPYLVAMAIRELWASRDEDTGTPGTPDPPGTTDEGQAIAA